MGAVPSLIFGAALAGAAHAQDQTTLAAPAVTIVLPPRLMAGHPATLAVLSADGRLVAGVTLDLGDGQTVTTDRTGRALFAVPAAREYLVARASGASAAALVDPAVGASEPKATTLPPVVSAHDGFWICGAELSGEADANTVKIDGQPALVIAASPVCLVALPGLNARPGRASISIESPGVESGASTVLVSLEFEPPKSALKPGEKGQLAVRAEGSDKKLRIAVQNESPSVLQFARGDVQELTTSGGSPNIVAIAVQAVTSGSFSFSARLLPATDAVSAARYLRAAESVAPKDTEHEISRLCNRLSRHPHDAKKVRAKLNQIAPGASESDFRALLDAARTAL